LAWDVTEQKKVFPYHSHPDILKSSGKENRSTRMYYEDEYDENVLKAITNIHCVSEKSGVELFVITSSTVNRF